MSTRMWNVGDLVMHRYGGQEGDRELAKIIKVLPDNQYNEDYLIRSVADVNESQAVSEHSLSSVSWEKEADTYHWINNIENKIDRILKHLGIDDE